MPAKQDDDYQAASYHRTVQPYKIGVMVDLPGDPGCSDLFVEGLDIAFEEMRELSFLDRPVELLVREYTAQPWDTGGPNIDHYQDLVQAGVLAVAGPMTTDNSLAVLPELDRQGVLSLSICGTQGYVGDYAFSLPNGGMADEPAILAAWIRSQGLESIAIFREVPSQIGAEYTRHMHYAAKIEGLDVTMDLGVHAGATVEELEGALGKLRDSNPDALVYLGLGRFEGGMEKITRCLSNMDWDAPRFMCASFVRAAYSRQRAQAFDGWVGLDQLDEKNPKFQHLMGLYQKRHGHVLEFPTSVFTCGYDIGRAFSHAMHRMVIATPEAVRDALETVTRMPSATGAAGTVVSFSKRNHRGFHGADYLVLRGVRDGRSVFVGTAPVA